MSSLRTRKVSERSKCRLWEWEVGGILVPAVVCGNISFNVYKEKVFQNLAWVGNFCLLSK